MKNTGSEISGSEEYAFLKGLTKLIRPLNLLEIGTSSGCATLAFALAMSKGKIVTIDIEDQRHQDVIEYSGPVKIEFIKSDSATAVRELEKRGEHFDLAFIDGGHHKNQVKADWEACRNICSTIIFHDALQFSGVDSVIQEIRKLPQWDVCVLDYPPVTISGGTEQTYLSKQVPGLAIATRVKGYNPPELTNLPGKPKDGHHELEEEWDKIINRCLLADSNVDLNKNDLIIITHLLRDLNPEFICHFGHIGTAASFLFHEYAKQHKIHTTFIDLNKFYERKDKYLPKNMTGIIAAENFNRNKLHNFLEGRKNGLIWVDVWGEKYFYEKNLPDLLQIVPDSTLVAVRNFSPDDGRPDLEKGPDRTICTNPEAFGLSRWLKLNSDFEVKKAKPELVFGDYVNAGHWIYIRKISTAGKTSIN